jgi:hypothetical protein
MLKEIKGKRTQTKDTLEKINSGLQQVRDIPPPGMPSTLKQQPSHEQLFTKLLKDSCTSVAIGPRDHTLEPDCRIELRT